LILFWVLPLQKSFKNCIYFHFDGLRLKIFEDVRGVIRLNGMAKEWPDTHKDKELRKYKKMNDQ